MTTRRRGSGWWILLHFPGSVALVMVLPVVAIGPLAHAMGHEFRFGAADVGLTFAVFFLASALTSGSGGYVIRHLGRSRTVRLGLLGSAAAAALLAVSWDRQVVYAGALLGGAVNGMTAVAISLTIMSDVEPGRRGLAFGLRMSGLPSAAAVAGLGAYLVADDRMEWRHFYVVVAVLALLSGLLTRCPSTSQEVAGASGGQSTVAGTIRTLTLLGLCGFLGSIGNAAVTPFLANGLIEQGESTSAAAAVLAVSGWVGIVSRVGVGALSDRVPNPLVQLRCAIACLTALAASMLLVAHAHGTLLLVIGSVTMFSLGLSWPGPLLFAALLTHQRWPARAAGSMQSGQHFGAVLGPALFGLTVAHGSYARAWEGAAAVVLIAAGALALALRSLVTQDG